MRLPVYFAAAASVIASATLTASISMAASEFTPAQKTGVEKIVHDYLVKNPEVIKEAIDELEKRQKDAEAATRAKAVNEQTDKLFNSPNQAVVGNPNGDVTLVEFFDYNCGYCKHAMSDMLTLLKTDPKLRVVLKEFPVLGPGSVEAAKVAVAVRMQDKTGQKYLEFHTKLLGGRGQADGARALAVAKDVGLDMTRLQKDLASNEIKATINENLKLGDELGLSGTPSYVIGKDVVVGAVGLDALKQQISTARCGKAAC